MLKTQSERSWARRLSPMMRTMPHSLWRSEESPIYSSVRGALFSKTPGLRCGSGGGIIWVQNAWDWPLLPRSALYRSSLLEICAWRRTMQNFFVPKLTGSHRALHCASFCSFQNFHFAMCGEQSLAHTEVRVKKGLRHIASHSVWQW